jgi:Na+-transporting NADH:ubiquinone oxidoreductase subunit F
LKLLRLRKLHRWVALVVGAQVFVWTASGLAFAWLDHADVTGEALAAAPAPRRLPVGATVLDPGRLPIARVTPTVASLELRELDETWVYRITTVDGQVALLRASDGAPYAIDGARAKRLAASHYRGAGRLEHVRRQPAGTLETRGLGPTWQVTFDDEFDTRLYFSTDDGALVAVRTDTWRLKDFLWMLHTMDYRGRDDFNNPLVVTAGAAAAWVGLTGIWLLLRVFRRRDVNGRDPLKIPGSSPAPP